MLDSNIKLVSKQELKSNRFGRNARIDAKHRIPVKDNFFTTLELTNIKNILYLTKEEEFIGAQIFNQTSEWMPGARDIGYDMMEPVGGARVGSQGAYAKDIPFVNEKLVEQTQKAVEIEIGIRYTRQEIEAAEAVNALGRGANLNLVQQRANTARRSISRLFDQGIFQGFADYNMKGLEDAIPSTRVGIPSNNNSAAYEAVQDTGTGSGDAKRLWANKTGQQIYNDLVRAKFEGVERANIFNGDTLIVDPVAFKFLNQSYSDLNGNSIISFVKDAGLFKNIFRTSALTQSISTQPNTYFVVCDTDVDMAEIPILRPITVFPSETEWNQEIKQLVALRYGGLLVKYPAAFYFADSHIETLV